MPEVDPPAELMHDDGMKGDSNSGKLFAFGAFLDEAFSV